MQFPLFAQNCGYFLPPLYTYLSHTSFCMVVFHAFGTIEMQFLQVYYCRSMSCMSRAHAHFATILQILHRAAIMRLKCVKSHYNRITRVHVNAMIDIPLRLRHTKPASKCRWKPTVFAGHKSCAWTHRTTETTATANSVRGINSLYQQQSIIYIRHLKGETEYTWYTQVNETYTKQHLLTILNISYVNSFHYFKWLMLLWKYSCIGMLRYDN